MTTAKPTIINPAVVAPTEETLRATCRREHPHCFVCSDPVDGGLGLRFQLEAGGAVKAGWTCPPGGESYPGIVHGGLLATLLDAAMVHALFARGVVARTGELRIRYRNPVRIGSPVVVRARVTGGSGRLFVLKAEVRQGAAMCAEAHAKFMQLAEDGGHVAATDFPEVMVAKPVSFDPIGVIRSEHQRAEATPIQPVYAGGCRGRAELRPEFSAGLDDLTGFSHAYLIYHLHRAGAPRLKVKPFLQDAERGVFATRAPDRPNPIGLSLVRLVGREGNILHLDGVDVLDGTPLLDIKPFAPRYDAVENPRGGWTDEVDDATAQERGRRGYRAAASAAPPP